MNGFYVVTLGDIRFCSYSPTKGISLADKCMTMATIAYNLKKLMKWEHKNRQEGAKALQQSLRAVFLRLTAPLNAFKCYYNLAFKTQIISSKNQVTF